jgi:PTH1 family peptidyl-tRNA hydrolase
VSLSLTPYPRPYTLELMGLFQRRNDHITETLYTVSIGQEQTKLIIGLGNPGKKYEGTRHNIGFACLDAMTETENGTWIEKNSLKCLISELRIGQTRVVLIKPTTFMNNSGEAAMSVQSYFKLNNTNTAVVHDEIDIQFGQIRTRVGGSSAGHNGVKSLIQHLGEDFSRIRIGVANDFVKQVDSADFVLQKFNKAEQAKMKVLKTEVTSLLNEFVFGDKIPQETRSFL